MIKKLKTFAFAVISACMMFVMGCSDLNNLGDDLSVNSSGSGKCTVEISLTNFGFGRTILPENWTKDQIANLTIVLKGKAARGDELAETELTKLATDGSEKVELTYDWWDLTLEAKDANGVVLQGSTSADLSNGAKVVPFTLSSKNIKTVGAVSLNGDYIPDGEDNPVDKIVMCLYNYSTGAKIAGTEVVTTKEDGQINDDGSFTYILTSVAAGTYNFQMDFYKIVGTTEKKIGNYGDLITILPGKTTEDTLTINTINKKPASPENLKVSFVENHEVDDYYVVQLDWEDKSYNEENFVITVYTYDSWAAEKTVYKTLGVGAKQFINDVMYESGSVLASNTTAQLRLNYGTIYDFGIQAQNCIGLSSDEPVMKVESDDYESHVAHTLITFNLNGGTLIEDGTPYDGEAYFYAAQFDGENDIAIPQTWWDEDGFTKNGYAFEGWYKTPSPEATDTVISKTDGVNNLNVWAKFNDKSAADLKWDEIAIDDTLSAYELKAERITIKIGEDELTDSTIVTTNGSTGRPDIVITVKAPEEGEPAFTNLKVQSENKVIATNVNNGNTITIPWNTYKDWHGNEKSFSIWAKCAETNQLYSYSFAIKFDN